MKISRFGNIRSVIKAVGNRSCQSLSRNNKGEGIRRLLSRALGWLSRSYRRGGARMCFEEIPDYIDRVHIVAGFADPFFREPILSAWPHVTEPLDRVVNDLAAFRALIVCDFIDA